MATEASCEPLHVCWKLARSKCRAYFPSLDDIKNHIAKVKKALQLSVVDQENAVKLIEEQKTSPDSHSYFRPYKRNDPNDSHCTSQSKLQDLDTTDFESTLTMGTPRSLATATNADVW